ncbi:MAG: hypothetical protein K1X57_14950 [Gemmataceae bacterium]|nr:hypothetical protein [Gemmataceae bacterium]
MTIKQPGNNQESNRQEASNAKQNTLAAVNNGLGVTFRIKMDNHPDMCFDGDDLTSLLADMIEESGYEATRKRIEHLADMMQENQFNDKHGGMSWQDANNVQEYIMSTAALMLDYIIANEEWGEDDDDIDDGADYDDCCSDDEEKSAAAFKRSVEGDDKA